MTAAITIHFKNADITEQCVNSLLADGWGPILVWDNSADAGISLGKLQDRYVANTSVILIRNNINLGFGKGMNAALAALGKNGYSGPVLLINNDAQVQCGLRSMLESLLERDKKPVLIAPRIEQNGQEQGWMHYHPWLALVTKKALWGSIPYLSGCCLLVHRVNNSEPLFDESFFMYGEDVELSWRMRRQGGKLVLLEKSYLRHIGLASSGNASAAYEQYLVRAHWLLAKKLAPNTLVSFIMLLTRIPSLLARACLRSWRYQSLKPIQAIGEIFN